MATGIPKTQQTNSPFFAAKWTSAEKSLNIEVSYPGKHSEQVVLATPVAKLKSVWQFKQAANNRLYYGDNLPILASLLQDPAIYGKVRLVYIDPPYATGTIFQSRNQTDAYEDLLDGASYIEFLRERLILLRELLAPDGSIYVHLDKNMAFPIKLIMDEVFGPKNFRNWITRKKCNPKNYTRRAYGNVADYLLFYTKGEDYVWHRPVENWTAAHAKKEYPCVDERGRRYKKVPVHAPGVRNGETGQSWRGMNPPPGKHWQYTPTRLDEMDAHGEIYWSPNGNPRRKVYLETSKGIPIQDVWTEFLDPYNQNSKITGYPTEKNPNLLARIIEASSNPGDIVLDCFAGSGTTLAVASQMKRHWIGVDNSQVAIGTTLRRFMYGLQPMGDFVTSKVINEVTSEGQLALPFEAGLTQETASITHEKIEDFTLLAEHFLVKNFPEQVSSSLSNLVDFWCRQLS